MVKTHFLFSRSVWKVQPSHTNAATRETLQGFKVEVRIQSPPAKSKFLAVTHSLNMDHFFWRQPEYLNDYYTLIDQPFDTSTIVDEIVCVLGEEC